MRCGMGRGARGGEGLLRHSDRVEVVGCGRGTRWRRGTRLRLARHETSAATIHAHARTTVVDKVGAIALTVYVLYRRSCRTCLQREPHCAIVRDGQIAQGRPRPDHPDGCGLPLAAIPREDGIVDIC